MPTTIQLPNNVVLKQDNQNTNYVILPNNSVGFQKLTTQLQTRITDLESSVNALESYSHIDLGVSTVVDWSLGNVFYNNISANKTFTLTNTVPGKTIIVSITNTGASLITVNFPASVKFPGGDIITDVAASKTNVYTFLMVNGLILVSAIEEY